MVTFTESYADKVEPVMTLSKKTMHRIVAGSHKVSAKIVANIEGFDATQIDSSMPIHIGLGRFIFDSTLAYAKETGATTGYPGSFPKSAKHATFQFFSTQTNPNGTETHKPAGTIVFKWTPTRLTVKVTIPDTANAGVSEIISSDFVGIYQDTSSDGSEPAGSVKIAGGSIDASIGFGSASGNRSVAVKGVSTSSYKKYGSLKTHDLDELFPETVTLTGH